jgi:hypothetical protein
VATAFESWQDLYHSWHTNLLCDRIGFEPQDDITTRQKKRTPRTKGGDLNHFKRPSSTKAGHEAGMCGSTVPHVTMPPVFTDTMASRCLQAIHRCSTGTSASIVAPQVHPIGCVPKLKVPKLKPGACRRYWQQKHAD